MARRFLDRTLSDESFLDRFAETVAALPAGERRRIERIVGSADVAVDSTHPPTRFRIAFLRSRPMPAAMTLDAADAAALDAELARDKKRCASDLLDLFRG